MKFTLSFLTLSLTLVSTVLAAPAPVTSPRDLEVERRHHPGHNLDLGFGNPRRDVAGKIHELPLCTVLILEMYLDELFARHHPGHAISDQPIGNIGVKIPDIELDPRHHPGHDDKSYNLKRNGETHPYHASSYPLIKDQNDSMPAITLDTIWTSA
ncbi:hypothetical protein FA15DRAFT_657822 [Coprinopsis marcescibilis]|uniref:Uncharacterized protein n=1 Tax=Coprinopsis marcescibilis TaxID=230819 RepID=A0A5C3KNL8_COPMA|nr:hypothetical protein FA15DRAFT_657822 [Coprinopsis marcescibilis]